MTTKSQELKISQNRRKESKKYPQYINRNESDILKENKKYKKIAAKDVNILSSFDESSYHPITKESQIAYTKILNFVQDKLGDYSENILRSASEEVLKILKSEEDQDKKPKIDDLFGVLTEDEFGRILTISKAITDFSLEDDVDMEDVDNDKGLTEKDMTVFLEDEKDDMNDRLEEIPSSTSNSESEDDEKEEDKIQTLTSKDKLGDVEEDKDILKVEEIDVHWIQREINKYLDNPEKSLELSKEIFKLLSETDEVISHI